MEDQRLKIAVVGTGAAGLTAAYLLQRQHDVTLFEKNNYAGGHNHTVVVDNGPDKGIPIDTGFMFLTDRTFPTFHRLLKQLSVPVRASEMTFGYYDEKSGLQYALTDLNGLLARRSNLLNPSFGRLLWDRARFNRKARRNLWEEKLGGLTLGEYLAEGEFSPQFVRDYLMPLGAVLWSTSVREMMDFPAHPFIRFLESHGFLGAGPKPQWQTLVGGAQSFVRAFLQTFKGKLLLNSPVEQVKRYPDRVLVTTRAQQEFRFDQVVLACHADEALALLDEPSEMEQRLLSVWSYQKNYTVLHMDHDVMPASQRAWATSNYIREMETTLSEPVSATYYMNRLQGFQTREPYFVTLNRMRPIPDRYILKEFYHTHPTLTTAAAASQRELPNLNGVNRTYFCGSYFGLGFHEDAVKSAAAVAKSFGTDL